MRSTGISVQQGLHVNNHQLYGRMNTKKLLKKKNKHVAVSPNLGLTLFVYECGVNIFNTKWVSPMPEIFVLCQW